MNKIKYIRRLMAISFSLPLCLGAAYTTSDEEWYDPRDWLDGDSVDYHKTDENVDTRIGQDNTTYASRDNKTKDTESNEWDDSNKDIHAGTVGILPVAYGYTFYIYTPGPSGEASWEEQKPSEMAGNSQKMKNDDRQYVRGSQSSSAMDEAQADLEFDALNNKHNWKDNKKHKGHEHMNISGEVAGFSSVKESGEFQGNDLVKIRLENGRSVTVDLGSETALNDLDLEKGDHIKIAGCRNKTGDKAILSAQTIRVAGKTVKSQSQDMNRSSQSRSQTQKDSESS